MTLAKGAWTLTGLPSENKDDTQHKMQCAGDLVFTTDSKTKEALSSLLHEIPMGIILLNQNGQVDYFNAYVEDFFSGISLGDHWTEVVNQQVIVSQSEQDLSLKNGSKISLFISTNTTLKKQVITFYDVTERSKIENARNETDRLSLLGRFAAAIIHQVRTPLATAMLYLSSAQTAGVSSAQKNLYISKSLNSLESLEGQIKALLCQVKGQRQVVKNITLLELSVLLEKHINESSHITIELDREVEEKTILANTDMLLGSFQNIIDNAKESNPADFSMHIKITISDKGEAIELCFQDNGPGFSGEALKYLFTKQYTNKASGTGIGLNVLKTTVESHNGYVSVMNTVDGGCVIVKLPISNEVS